MASEQNQQNDMAKNSNIPPPYSQAECVPATEQQRSYVHQQAPAPSAALDDWMPSPQHTPLNCPDGLQYLSTVDQLNVIRKLRFLEINSKYTIVNKFGQKVFNVVEETGWFTYNKSEMNILDKRDNEIIHLSRPHGRTFPNIKVYSPAGSIVGTVQQDWSVLKTVFTIRNAANEDMFTIKGPNTKFSLSGSDVKFKVFSKGKKIEVGHISKQWSGFLKEVFTDANNFCISFPMDLDVRMKAVMIGACFLIDFLYFEKIN